MPDLTVTGALIHYELALVCMCRGLHTDVIQETMNVTVTRSQHQVEH